MEDLSYPVGRFQVPREALDPAGIARCIDVIAECPSELRQAIRGLDARQLDTPYRPGGWTVRQVVHHLPDSHMNAYVRMKLTMTEDTPTIRTYDEQRWAELPEAKSADPIVSLALLESLHQRWVLFLRALAHADFSRPLNHPDWGTLRLDQLVAQYEWHCRHHVAHITRLREREGW